jgi:uncharacterized repeat protein (TIGR03843 family)
MTDLLRDGALRVLGRYVDASNATFLAEIEDGGRVIRCVYKPTSGERPLWDFPAGTLAGREVAAFLVSEALGWELIPRTLLREGPAGIGMVQEWIEHDDVREAVSVVASGQHLEGTLEIFDGTGAGGEPVTLVHRDDDRLRLLALLDAVLNNADRKGGHVLTSAAGRLYGVDHGICFHVEHKLRTVLWGWAGAPIRPEHLVDLRRLHGDAATSSPLATALAAHIADEELEALLDRIAALLGTGVMPQPRAHGPSIPWPPL